MSAYLKQLLAVVIFYLFPHYGMAEVWVNRADAGLISSIKLLADAGEIQHPVLIDELLWNQVAVSEPFYDDSLPKEAIERYRFYRLTHQHNQSFSYVSFSGMNENWRVHKGDGESNDLHRLRLYYETRTRHLAYGVAINQQESGGLNLAGSWLAHTWGSGAVSLSKRLEQDLYTWGDGLLESATSEPELKASIRQILPYGIEVHGSAKEQTSLLGKHLHWKATLSQRINDLEYAFEYNVWQQNPQDAWNALEAMASGEANVVEEMTLVKFRKSLIRYQPLSMHTAVYGQAALNIEAATWLAGLEISKDTHLVFWLEANKVGWNIEQQQLLSQERFQHGLLDNVVTLGTHWNYVDSDWIKARVRVGDREDWIQLSWKTTMDKGDLDIGMQWGRMNDDTNDAIQATSPVEFPNESRVDLWLRYTHYF
jgi:hypothetical protein